MDKGYIQEYTQTYACNVKYCVGIMFGEGVFAILDDYIHVCVCIDYMSYAVSHSNILVYVYMHLCTVYIYILSN